MKDWRPPSTLDNPADAALPLRWLKDGIGEFFAGLLEGLMHWWSK